MFASLKSLNLHDNQMPSDHYKILYDFLIINRDRAQKHKLSLLKIEKDKIISDKSDWLGKPIK